MKNFSSLHYRPCVGLMVVNRQRKIFTAQRLGFSSEAWQMPQGGIEDGEDALTAAYRELQEETSIDREKVQVLATSKDWLRYELPADLKPKLWNGLYKGQTQKWFLMRFLGTDSDVNLKTSVPEFSSWRWSSKNQLVKSIVSFKKQLYCDVLREFEKFL